MNATRDSRHTRKNEEAMQAHRTLWAMGNTIREEIVCNEMSVTRLPKDKIEGNAAKEEIRQCLEIGENKKVAMRRWKMYSHWSDYIQNTKYTNKNTKIQKNKRPNNRCRTHNTMCRIKKRIQNTKKITMHIVCAHPIIWNISMKPTSTKQSSCASFPLKERYTRQA